MRVLVACEFSGVVREEFRKLGHDAWSCDILPTEIPGNHYQCDVLNVLHLGWDLLIAFPPCTYLCVSGARWFEGRKHLQKIALAFVKNLMLAPIPRICIENPVGIISTRIRKPDQTFQPWMFGHGEVKRTCLWFKNLPLLVPTAYAVGREERIHNMSPGKDRGLERSRTFIGVAKAMSQQWSQLPILEYSKPLL